MTQPSELTDKGLFGAIEALESVGRSLDQELVRAQTDMSEAESRWQRLNKLKAFVANQLDEHNREKQRRL